jgi:hypothetical protein
MLHKISWRSFARLEPELDELVKTEIKMGSNWLPISYYLDAVASYGYDCLEANIKAVYPKMPETIEPLRTPKRTWFIISTSAKLRPPINRDIVKPTPAKQEMP